MKTYSSFKKNENSNRIVEDLNAKVYSLTFLRTDGVQKADLYHSNNSGYMLVAHNTCAPINSKYIKTVNIVFN